MKKEVTHKYEVDVCDLCGREEDASLRMHLKKCCICGKDICEFCGAKVTFLKGDELSAARLEWNVCLLHIPQVFKKK